MGKLGQTSVTATTSTRSGHVRTRTWRLLSNQSPVYRLRSLPLTVTNSVPLPCFLPFTHSPSYLQATKHHVQESRESARQRLRREGTSQRCTYFSPVVLVSVPKPCLVLFCQSPTYLLPVLYLQARARHEPRVSNTAQTCSCCKHTDSRATAGVLYLGAASLPLLEPVLFSSLYALFSLTQNTVCRGPFLSAIVSAVFHSCDPRVPLLPPPVYASIIVAVARSTEGNDC